VRHAYGHTGLQRAPFYITSSILFYP